MAHRSKTRGAAWLALELGLVLGLVLWTLRGTWGLAVGRDIDLWGSIWFHGWVTHCVTHGVYPGFTTWLYHPAGLDLFAQMGANFLDMLLAVPLRLWLGVPGYMAPFAALVMVGNALAMRALLRAMGLGPVAVLAGALLFALHPYLLAEVNGARFPQAFLWFWPLALRELLLMQDDRRWRRPLLAGLFLGLQAWGYWFYGHIFVLTLGPALLLAGLLRRRDRGYWLRLAAAAGACLVVVGPALVVMATRHLAGQVPGMSVQPGAPPEALHPAWDPAMSWWLLAPGPSVLRVPWEALAVGAAGLLACRRRALWIPAALLALALAAGPQLVLGGDGPPRENPLWAAVQALHLGISRLHYPHRFWAALALVFAAAVAEAVQRVAARWGEPGAAAPALALLLAGLGPSSPEWLTVDATPIHRPRHVDAIRRAPGPVLDLPLLCAQEALHLQPLHESPMVAGLGIGSPFLRPPGTEERLRADPRLAAAIDIARGLRGGAGGPDGAPAEGTAKDLVEPVRWVVYHLRLLRRSGCPEERWRGPAPAPGPEAMAAQVERRLTGLLGPPTVSGPMSLAWDLTALTRGDRK